MANPERGEVALTVGDQEYILRPSISAIRQLQQRMGGKTYGAVIRAMDDLDVDAIAQLLFTFLQPYHAKEFQKLPQVEALMDAVGLGNLHIVTKTIAEMLVLNLPPKDEAGKGSAANPPDAQAGTSNGSGPTPAASA